VTLEAYPPKGEAATYLPTTLAVTAWQKVNNPLGTRRSISWLDFCERLNHPRSCTNKKDLSGWAPAFFRGDHREKERCEGVSALVWDYEKGTTSPQEAEVFFRDLCMGALHTSYSHQPNTPRFRVVLPFSRLASPEEHARLWAWMFDKLNQAGHKIDASCKDPSRLWFAPGHHPEAAELYEAIVWEGEPLDVDALLAELPREATKEQPRIATNARAIVHPIHKVPNTISEAPNAEERARLYLQRMDAAFSGQGGHNTTYRAACAMVLGFDLSTDAALSLLLSDFNPRCYPQWSEKELRHKVESANKETKPRGYLLAEKKERQHSTPSSFTIHQREKTIAEEIKAPTRQEAAIHIQNAIRRALSTKNQIGVVVVPCGGGKSYAALQLIKAWDTLRLLEEPFPSPLALLASSHKLARELKDRAELLGITTTRYFSPPGSGGPRQDPPVFNPKKTSGPLVCIKPRSTVEGHTAAGVPGHKLCYGCPMSQERGGDCKAEPGRIGPEEAALHVGVHHSPTLPLEKARALVIDEWPEIIQSHIVTLEGLRALSKGCLSLLDRTRKTLQAAAKSVLSWLEKGAPKEEDPLQAHREALKELGRQDDGKTSVELARDPAYKPHRSDEDKGALVYRASWKAGTALVGAALEGGKIYSQGDGNAAWNGLSATAKALAEVENAVILTATPGDIEELQKITGKKIIVTKIPIRPVAPIEFVLKPSSSSTRRGYLDGHGRPLWQRAPDKRSKSKTPQKAALVQDIEDLTAWLRERQHIRSLLVGTYRPVALFLRLEWASARGATPNQEDIEAWEALHGGNRQKALGRASQGRAALDAFFSLLREREIELDVVWYHAGSGLNDWREKDREFDACATIGNPNPPVDEHRKRYSEARGIELSSLADEDPEWQAAYDAAASGEAGQLHGRLGDVGRAAHRPAWHLHIGRTTPAGWEEAPITEHRRPKHRPTRQTSPGAESWLDDLAVAVQELAKGEVAALSRLWGVPARTLRRFVAGERAPNEATFAKLREWSEERARGGLVSPAHTRPVTLTEDIESTAIGVMGRLENPAQESAPGVTLGREEDAATLPPLASPSPLAADGPNWPDPVEPRAFYLPYPAELLPDDLEPDYDLEEHAARLEADGIPRDEAERLVGLVRLDWARFDPDWDAAALRARERFVSAV
jgi:hypothetical protein